MKKITSFQRRQDRWRKSRSDSVMCDHDGQCGSFAGRWSIANDRQWRRTMCLIDRGKLQPKQCVQIPCPS